MTAENRSRDGGNVWMIVLIALALIATVIMLFSDSAVWLQIALLAALWAAICGFLLVSRTRNDRDRARAELDAREREHQAEIEVLRARNDADRSALEAARAGEGLPPAVDVEVLREIRAELATLRAQLEDLSGREFGYEPAALQAEARRVMEIEARASRVAPAAESTQPAQAPIEPQQERQPQRPASAASGASNAAEETSRIAPVRDADENQAINALSKQPKTQPKPKQQARPSAEGSTRLHGAPSAEAVAGRVGTHRAPEGRNPLTDLIRERQEELERERVERERQQREAQERRQREERERAEKERAERERQQREQEAQRAREEKARRVETPEQEPESRGRRRADENRDGALTVAELLARSKKGQ